MAGYLEGGDYASSAKVGALAGLIAYIPVVLTLAIVLLVVPVTVAPAPGFQLALWVSLLLILLLAAVYTVGLSSLGGALGVYVKEEV